MIHSITSDLDSFKSLAFGQSLNIVLAEKGAEATDRQTRNGAGKSSFVELVHFIFGSNADKKSIFRSDTLTPHTFEIQADIGGHVMTAARSGSKPGPPIRVELIRHRTLPRKQQGAPSRRNQRPMQQGAWMAFEDVAYQMATELGLT